MIAATHGNGDISQSSQIRERDRENQRLTELKGKRTRLEMELAGVNDQIKRIEDSQQSQHQAARGAWFKRLPESHTNAD